MQRDPGAGKKEDREHASTVERDDETQKGSQGEGTKGQRVRDTTCQRNCAVTVRRIYARPSSLLLAA